MTRLGRASVLRPAILVGCLALVAVLVSQPSLAHPSSASTKAFAARTKPTVVLVHGAFADASGWRAEINYLTRHGYPVIAPADPLRGLTADADYIRSVLATIQGPVVLVGHSYGGMVITNAARGESNVKALVYVSAFIPKYGQSAAYLETLHSKGVLLNQSTLLARPIQNPYAGRKDVDLYIKPTDFRAVFAADESRHKAAELAVTQRPVTNFAFNEPSGSPAWKDIPSWAVVGLEDRAISPVTEATMARQAHAHTITIHSAHDSLISHPRVVDRLIVAAATSTR